MLLTPVRDRSRQSTRAPAALLGAAVAALSLAVPAALAQPQGDRAIAVADVHGAFDRFAGILREAGVIDGDDRWSGGRTTLVQLGDVTDRGIRVREVLDLLMALEAQAPRSGGRVVALLGNHETMNMTRYLRDVSTDVYPAFADERSESRRRDAYRRYVRLVATRRATLGTDPFTSADEATWMAAHPPGFLEYVEAFGPSGRYGEWLRTKDAIAKVGRTVFLHGGLNPEWALAPIDDMNRRVRAELARFDAHTRRLVARGVILPFFTFDETLDAATVELDWWAARLQPGAGEPVVFTEEDREYLRDVIDLLQSGAWSIVSPDGPLWFRGFAQWTDEQGRQGIDELLARYGADRFVVGHSPTAVGRVVPRFDHRVFLIDTGMLAEVYMGRASALEIADAGVTAIYEDGRLMLTGQPAAVGVAR